MVRLWWAVLLITDLARPDQITGITITGDIVYLEVSLSDGSPRYFDHLRVRPCLQSLFPTINCRIIIAIIVISTLSVINVVISNILYLTYMDYPIAWRHILRAKVTRDGELHCYAGGISVKNTIIYHNLLIINQGV